MNTATKPARSKFSWAAVEPSPLSRKPVQREPKIAFAAGLVLTCALYWSNLSGGYLSDDFWLMDGLRRFGPTAYWFSSSSFFRPQAAFELWAIDHLFPAQPWVLRVTSLAFFLMSIWLVRLLTLRLLSSDDPSNRSQWTATFAALLFALYPSHAEPVNWICCISDTAGLAEGVTAFLLLFGYLRSRGSSRWAYFAAVAGCLSLALISKEIFLIFPPLLLALGLLLLRDSSTKQKVSALVPLAALNLLLLGGYVFVHNLLGNQWGYTDQHYASRAVELRNLTLGLPNVFFPLTKWIAHGRQELMLWPAAALGLAFALWVVLLLPVRADRISRYLGKALAWCARNRWLLYFVGTATLFYLAELWQTNPFFEAIYLAALGIIVFLARNANWERLSLVIAGVFVVSCLLLIPREDLLVYEFFHLSGLALVGRGKIAASLLLLFAFTIRGRFRPWTSEQLHLLKIVGLFVGAAVAMLLPSMGVWTGVIQVDGRGQRLAYESTFFAAIAVAIAFSLCFGKRPKLFAGMSIALLGINALGLYLNNRDWAYAGSISSNIVKQLGPLLATHPHRIYMLSAVFYAGEAEVFHNGDSRIISAGYPGSGIQLRDDMAEWNHIAGDRVVLVKANLKTLTFRLGVCQKGLPSDRSENAGFIAYGSGAQVGWFKNSKDGEIRIRGFRRGDRIVYVDEDQLRVIL